MLIRDVFSLGMLEHFTQFLSIYSSLDLHLPFCCIYLWKLNHIPLDFIHLLHATLLLGKLCLVCHLNVLWRLQLCWLADWRLSAKPPNWRQTTAIPGSSSYAPASGNSKITQIRRITPFTPQPHFYLLLTPIFSEFYQITLYPILPLFCRYIFLPEAPSPPWDFHTGDLGGIPGVELLPNLRTWRLHYLNVYVYSSTFDWARLLNREVCAYNWEDVLPISACLPHFPTFSHIPFSACTNFSHIVPHIQSVGTVSMEDNPWNWSQSSFAWSFNWTRLCNTLSHTPIVGLS